jgi:hypothetical protein
VQWTAAPDLSRDAPAQPDTNLVAMGRWGQHFLVHNANPELGYACRFSLDWSCPPKELGVDLVANGDTDCRSDWEFMFLAEMCGPGKTAEAAQGVRRRILGYPPPGGVGGMECNPNVHVAPDGKSVFFATYRNGKACLASVEAGL